MHYVSLTQFMSWDQQDLLRNLESIGKSWIHAQTQGTDQHFVLRIKALKVYWLSGIHRIHIKRLRIWFMDTRRSTRIKGYAKKL
jgi:hypothetical protein